MDITEILLNKYNIPNLYPDAWPADKDVDSDSDAEDAAPAPAARSAQSASRTKSRYSVLESAGSFSRQKSGVEKTEDGVESLVMKDEGDPLGTYPSVVKVLRQRGLRVEDDVKLRCYLLIQAKHLPQPDAATLPSGTILDGMGDDEVGIFNAIPSWISPPLHVA